MTQTIQYENKVISRAISGLLGIDSVDLSEDIKVFNNINNVIKFLSLDQYIKVSEAYSFLGYPRFTLESINSTSVKTFRQTVKKIKAHLDSHSMKACELELIDEINQIKQFIASIPKDYQIFIGTSYLHESEIKVQCYFSEFSDPWYFHKFSKNEYCNLVNKYFIKQKYESNEGSDGRGNSFYLFARTKNMMQIQSLSQNQNINENM